MNLFHGKIVADPLVKLVDSLKECCREDSREELAASRSKDRIVKKKR